MNPSLKEVFSALAAGKKKKHTRQTEPGKKSFFIHHRQACFLKQKDKLLPYLCEGIYDAKPKKIAMVDYVHLLLRF